MEEDGVGFSVQNYIGQGDVRGTEEKPQIGYCGNLPISFPISADEPPIALDAETCIMADYQRGPELGTPLRLIAAAFFKCMGYRRPLVCSALV